MKKENIINSENPKKGAEFQKQVKQWFQQYYGRAFKLEEKIAIGNPPKFHKFDIVDVNNSIVIECKCYTWTETGNVPSAKMGFCNEAAFYLSFLSNEYEKYIVLLYSWNERRNETLAEYYFRTNNHLLGKTKIAEYNPKDNKLRIIGSSD